LRVPLALIAAAICLIAGIVALVIVLLKTGSLTDATTAPAMYPFIAAMFLTAYGGRAVIPSRSGIG
jgi:hypothetical protein